MREHGMDVISRGMVMTNWRTAPVADDLGPGSGKYLNPNISELLLVALTVPLLLQAPK